MIRFRLDVLLVLALIMIFYWPICNGQQKYLHLTQAEYDVYYDTQLNSPRAVRWLILPFHLLTRYSRNGMAFASDDRLPKPRAASSDYVRSGYQRGHLCPAADRAFSLSSMKRTFLMSNISPQVADLNTGEWKTTEVVSRAMARQFGRCSVAVAPIFLNEDTFYIGHHHVAVPHAFFKIAWVPERWGIFRMWFFFNK